MTEQEWLTSDDPLRMLTKVIRRGVSRRKSEPGGSQDWASSRKLRLFGVACVIAAGVGTESDWQQYENGWGGYDSEAWARRWARRWAAPTAVPDGNKQSDKANFLRTIVGNPWQRPMTLTRTVECDRCNGKGQRTLGQNCGTCDGTGKIKGNADWLTHADGRVPKLAQVIYDERRWSEMGMLADALEESGCRDEAMLNHCRGLVLSPVEPGDSLKIVDDPLRLIHFDETGIIAATVVSVKGSEMTVQPSNAAIGDYGVWSTAFKWVSRNAPFVRGDWVIDLLLGRE